MLQIPQVFPPLSVMYPDYPQFTPHEFLTTQCPSNVWPVSKTPWFNVFSHF